MGNRLENLRPERCDQHYVRIGMNKFNGPRGIALDTGDRLYVCDSSNGGSPFSAPSTSSRNTAPPPQTPSETSATAERLCEPDDGVDLDCRAVRPKSAAGRTTMIWFPRVT
jgi:hypothetical protein